MSTSIQASLASSFAGEPVGFLEYGGVPIVLAQHVAASLGYALHAHLAQNIRDRWGDSFDEGKHYLILSGDDLDHARSALAGPVPDPRLPPAISSKARSAMFLTEPGLYKAIMRSGMPAADDFLEWIASEVMPAIRKTGSYSVDPDSSSDSASVIAALHAAGLEGEQLVRALHALGASPSETVKERLLEYVAKLDGVRRVGMAVFRYLLQRAKFSEDGQLIVQGVANREIATAIRYERRSVRRGLRELIDAGAIKVQIIHWSTSVVTIVQPTTMPAKAQPA